jgi:asparagine synthase (glutamine-hydrolysing)
MYAIPREQLVRPGQRRSLMRRALVGIVPDELLNRKRKAFVIRSPMAAISKEYISLIEMSHEMLAASREIIDASAFCEAVQKARQGQEIRIVAMKRTLEIESWLRIIRDRGILVGARQLSPDVPHCSANNAGRSSDSPRKTSAS